VKYRLFRLQPTGIHGHHTRKSISLTTFCWFMLLEPIFFLNLILIDFCSSKFLLAILFKHPLERKKPIFVYFFKIFVFIFFLMVSVSFFLFQKEKITFSVCRFFLFAYLAGFASQKLA